MRGHIDSRPWQWESQDSSMGQRMGTMRCSAPSSTQDAHQVTHILKPVAPGHSWRRAKFQGPLRRAGSQGHTGKDRDVVLIGLVQRVVDNALLIWEAFEDVHADLVEGESQNH